MNNRKEYMKKWQENNRDKTRESAKRWYNKNIEKIKDKRQTDEYKEKHREYNKKYRQNQQQELERYKNIVDELDNKLCSTWQLYYDHSRLTRFKCEDMLGLIEQIRNDIKELKGE